MRWEGSSCLARIGLFVLSPAFLAKFRIATRLRSAVCTSLDHWKRPTALGAKLAALSFRTTSRTRHRSCRLSNARDSAIDASRLFMNLFPGNGRLRQGPFFIEVGSATLAQLDFLVPTHLRADPTTAARTLLELFRDFLGRFLQRRVVSRTADGSLDLVGTVGRTAEQTAEQTSRCAKG